MLFRRLSPGKPGCYLALALLVARVGADDHHPAVATNDLAVVADLLDAGLYLHVGSLYSLSSYSQGAVSRYFSANVLLVAVGDATTCEVVGCELYEHAIFRKDANVVLTHLSRNVGKNQVSIRQFDAELCVRERLDDATFELNDAFFLLFRTILLGHSLTITW